MECKDRLTELYEVPVSDSISVRVYSDTQPHNLKISGLQKGLVLRYKKAETVGEGTGLGLPVLIYTDETHFSGTSRVEVAWENEGATVTKEFMMDRIARNRFRNVTLENRRARDLITFLAQLYQKYPKLRFLALKGLARNIDIGTTFIETEPAGSVTVKYTIDRKNISVKADFRQIPREGLQCLFMLNEQGSEFFRKYFDASGTELNDTEIGAWNGVEADWAALTLQHNGFGFRLWKIENSVLRRGREFLKHSLDWVGLDYEIRRNARVFEYPIEILGA